MEEVMSLVERVLREALGAHIQADAYRDSMPDSDEDARFLRKQETWWRLTARSWLDEALASECAEAAKRRVIASPEHQAIVKAALARLSS